MATLSRRTLGLACRLIAEKSHTDIRQLFYENEVPPELDHGSNRLNRVLNVFQYFEENGNVNVLLALIESAMTLLNEEDRAQLADALLHDGLGVVDEKLLDAEPESQENRSVMEAMLDRHVDELDIATLRHHLHEGTDLFRQEKWDSSITHCRNFVEQLLADIAQCIATDRSESPNISRPAQVRDYLESVGFFDSAERKKLVDGVYGYFSEEGPHPGISTQSAARISNSILASFGLYVVEKLDAWKSGELRLK